MYSLKETNLDLASKGNIQKTSMKIKTFFFISILGYKPSKLEVILYVEKS